MKKVNNIVLVLFLGSGSLLAEEILKTGTVSIFVLKNGKPLYNNEIIIDNSKTVHTDRDGWIKERLHVGKHQLQVFGREQNGTNIGYIKKPFVVKRDRDTQIIATFDVQNVLNAFEVDTPIGEGDQNSTLIDKSTGKAVIEGVVFISKSNTPISGARLFVKGTDIDARTDASGKFSVEVPSDVNLSISVVHSAYSARTINDIKLKNGETSTQRIELTPASMELEEFVVLAPKIEGSIASVMAEEKESSSIANILGSEELSKKGDSSAAGALKRVTGITLVGGENVYVRGLGERYSNIELNSLPLPSPNPQKRVVPLDIFPAGVIGSLKVQKSASADIPSNFGGGYINIRTKDQTKDNYVKVSVGINANSDTGSDYHSYKGSDSDWTGFDDGYRDINSEILDATTVYLGERLKYFTTSYFTPEELVKFTQDFVNRDYSVKKESIPLGYGTSIEVSQKYNYNDDHQFALFANYGYTQKHSYSEEAYLGYSYSQSAGTLYKNADRYGTNQISSDEYSHGGIFNLGYTYKDFLRMKYTKLYTVNSEKNTRISEGIQGSNYDYFIRYYLNWEERVLNSDQITGEYEYDLWNFYNVFGFGAEIATATLWQPNNYNYDYITENGITHLNTYSTNNIADSLDSQDDMLAFYINNKTYLDLFTEDDYVDVGFSVSNKERTSRKNKYSLYKNTQIDFSTLDLTQDIESIYDQYVRADYEYAELPYYIGTMFTDADYFDAEVNEYNFYLNSLIKPHEQFEVLAGLRYVDLTQTVYQYEEDRTNPDMSKRRQIQLAPTELTVSDVFPSISIKYKLTDDHHFDIAASKTFIVPDLREFTSGSYAHPYEVADIVGNPDLENTTIYNLDLKYSFYISDTESIKTGLFYKYLDKPIEDTQIYSSSLTRYSFDNADNAVLYGFELDGRKNLDILKEELANYYVSGNMSFTESDVTLRKEQEATFTTNHRQLQGLSRVVVNATLGFDNKQRSIALSYNKMGERIRKVGLIDGQDRYPDYIEVPPTLLDFAWTERFKNGFEMRAKIGNILDDETVWKQGDNITNSFKTGQTYSFGASYKF